ncbi:MAG: hypothetical protein EA412_14035 [Chitinophagaceae bacterium]|nr:MAG: hypothetical protein EA412_14035 [Chitinophagaceae bacterium]
MKRRSFIKKSLAATAGIITAPYILPSGRLFASTGNRIANHVVFMLFAGGIRNQESIDQLYLATQGMTTQGNVMENMLSGSQPSGNLVYNRWSPILSNPLSQQGSLFKELRYKEGPTGHYNGHTVAMTGNYTYTGLNLNVNPEYPTIFEYYRKHTDPSKSALNAWWLSEGLGPYPSLNYSRHPMYGAAYGANYMRPATVFGNIGQDLIPQQISVQPDDVSRIRKTKDFLNKSFKQASDGISGIANNEADRKHIQEWKTSILNGSTPMEWATPTNSTQGLTGDLMNISSAWMVLKEFKPELTVINTFNLDICHTDFSSYLSFLHRADYGVGWLWNKIQSDPVLANDTILICMPEHGRNLQPNSIYDNNGLRAFDHTSDDNSRRIFSLIVGPSGKVNHNASFGTEASPIGESIDIVPTIAHILGFDGKIPSGLLPGRVLNEAFV